MVVAFRGVVLAEEAVFLVAGARFLAGDAPSPTGSGAGASSAAQRAAITKSRRKMPWVAAFALMAR